MDFLNSHPDFFEDGSHYQMCIGDGCVEAIGKHNDNGHDVISYSHEWTLSDGTKKTENICFYLESLTVSKYGSVEGRLGAWYQKYEIKGPLFVDSESNTVTFYMTLPNSSEEPIAVSIKKV